MNEQERDRTELREIAERMLADGRGYAEIESVFRHAVALADENHSQALLIALDMEDGTVAR